MVASDVISMGGLLWSTHVFQQELQASWRNFVWIATRRGKLLGLLEVALHSGGQIILGFIHMENITLGVGEQ